MFKLFRKLTILALWFMLCVTAYAEDHDAEEFGRIEFIDGGRNDGKEQWVQIVFHLNPHWKTYWKHPGQNGLVPQLDFSASENIENIELFWSPPRLVGEEAIAAVGYEDMASLILRIDAKEPDTPITLNISGQFGICEKICIPLPYALNQKLDDQNKLDAKILSQRAESYTKLTKCDSAPEMVLTLQDAEDGTGRLIDFRDVDLAERLAGDSKQYGLSASGICQFSPELFSS